MCDNLNLSIASLVDLDNIAEVAGPALNLDSVVEELVECGEVEDLVVDGLRGVDCELHQAHIVSQCPFSSTRMHQNQLAHGSMQLTFLVTLPCLVFDLEAPSLGVLGVAAFCFTHEHLAYCMTHR